MKALAAGLAVALVALGMLGGKLWRDLRAERSANQVLVTGTISPPPLQDAPPSGAPLGVAPPQQVAAAPASPAGPPPGVGAADTSMADMAQAVRAYFDTPEGQEFQRVIARQQLQQQYSDIGEKLGLSTTEVEKLLDMLVRHQMIEAPIQMEAMAGGRDAAAIDALYRRLAVTERDHGTELQALLGEKFPRWLEYQRDAATRQREDMLQRQSQQLRTAITSSGRHPLTDPQFEALSAALTAEEQRFDREHMVRTEQEMLAVMDERARRLGEVAAVHLNSEQLAQYRAYLRQQADTVRAMAGMMGGAAGAAGN